MGKSKEKTSKEKKSKEKKSKEKSCCNVNNEDVAYHSRYIKIIIFVVTLGCFPCGMAVYWELIILYSRNSHLSMQLMFLVAIVLGAIPAGIIIPHVGRRRPLIFSTLLFFPAIIVNALYQGHHFCDLCVRVLGGIAIGGFLTAAIIYVGELPLNRYRGRYYALLGLGYFLGAATYSTLFYLHAWLSLIFLIFPLLYFILALIYLPETPYFVMQLQREGFASEVLYFIRCGSLNLQKIELEEIKVFAFESDCLHKYGTVDRCLRLLILICFSYFSGFPLFLIATRAAIYYITYTLVIVFSFLGWITFYFISEKRTRCGILIISAVGMLIANILLLVYFALLQSEILLFVSLIVFFFFYFIGFACMFFLFLGESFPYRSKHYSCAFGVVVYFLTFSFSCFLMRELMLAVGPFLTTVHCLVHTFLALLFAIILMPKYRQISYLNIQSYFDAVEL